MNTLILATFIFSVVLSWFLTSQVRQYALAKNLLDFPNVRSSHSVPTPRGGGIAIVIVLLLSGVVSLFLPNAPINSILCLLLATLAFGVLGWQDDKHDLSASVRFLVQILIAALSSVWLLWNLSGWSLSFVGIVILLLTVLWIVWMANEHIPEVMATGKFVDIKIYKVLLEKEDSILPGDNLVICNNNSLYTGLDRCKKICLLNLKVSGNWASN